MDGGSRRTVGTVSVMPSSKITFVLPCCGVNAMASAAHRQALHIRSGLRRVAVSGVAARSPRDSESDYAPWRSRFSRSGNHSDDWNLSSLAKR